MSDLDESSDPIEALKAKHRKEKKELKEKCLSMKKAAKCGNKQKQKEVQAEIDAEEKSVTARQEKELEDLAKQVSAINVNTKNNDDTIEKDTADNFYKEVKINSKHRKEKKELKEKCLSMKKAAKCGNKQKQKEVQAEIDAEEKSVTARQEKELEDLAKQVSAINVNTKNNDDTIEKDTADNFYKEVKINSKRQKQQAKKEEAAKRLQEAVKEDRANLTSSFRFIEREALTKALNDVGLCVVEIAPDGDCLYNSIAHQLSRVAGNESVTGSDMRKRAAKFILDNRQDFAPFLTDENGEPLDDLKLEEYCNKVENMAVNGGVWGGEPEINSLSRSLQRRILVIQPEGRTVSFGDEFTKTKPLTIVYQRHAYQLGEHYNSTEPKTLLNSSENMGRRRKSSGKSVSESSGDGVKERFEEEQQDEDVPRYMMTPQFNESGIIAQSTPLLGGRFKPGIISTPTGDNETLLAGNLNQSWMESTISFFFQKEKSEGISNSGFNRAMLFMIAVVIMALAAMLFQRSSPVLIFESKIPQFTRSFSLPVHDEQLLIHIGNKWLSEDGTEPSEPVILTVAGKKSNAFVTGLLEIAGHSIGKKSLIPKKVSSITSRAELHEQVFTSGEKVIAITSVEKMPWDVPLVLHAIADHISQNDVGNSFIMLAVDMPISEENVADCDIQIERELSTRWKQEGGDQDNIPPILSRILSYTICL